MIVTPFDMRALVRSIDWGTPVRVETTTLLPGGSLATLSIRQVGAYFVVSDDNAGREALSALGIDSLTSGDTRRGNEIAAANGLSFEGTRFTLADVAAAQLSSAIVHVAEACRIWVEGALDARSRRREKVMIERAAERLRVALPGLPIEFDRSLIGASTKPHRFDLVMTLPRDRFAVFETALPAAVSLASIHLKFYDIKHAAADWPREALIDDVESWASEDLAVVQQVASHVRPLGAAWNDLAAIMV